MKSYRVAVFILLILMGVSIYLYIYVQNSALALKEEAQRILDVLEKDDAITEEIKDDIKKLSEDAERDINIWNYIINQCETEKAYAAISSCIGYSSAEASPDVVYSLYQFCFYTDNIINRERIRFSNIL